MTTVLSLTHHSTKPVCWRMQLSATQLQSSVLMMTTLDPMEISLIPSRAQSVSVIIMSCSSQSSLTRFMHTVEVFAVDRLTGVITVSGSLDSETLNR